MNEVGMQRIRVLARAGETAVLAVAAILTAACSFSANSREQEVARTVGFDSAVCQPADSDLACDVFENRTKVLTNCIVYARPGAAASGDVSGCRRVGDVHLKGQKWDDVDERFKAAGLRPEIGFPGRDTNEEFEATLEELDRDGQTIYQAFVFRTNRAAAKYVGRPTRVARLLLGSASPPDLKATLKGTTLRRGTLLVWYRKGVPSLTPRLRRVLAGLERGG